MKKHRSKTKTFRERLTKDFLVVAVILILLLSTVFIFTTVFRTREEIENTMAASAELVSEQFTFITDNMSFISSYLLSDMDFLMAATELNKEGIGAGEMLEYYKTIQSPIINYSIVTSKYNVTFFNDRGIIAASNDYNLDYSFSSRVTEEEWARMPWIDVIRNILGKAVLLPVQAKPFERSSEEALMFVREVRAPGERMGYFIVDISEEDLVKTIDMDTGYDSSILIEDENGNLIYYSENTPKKILSVEQRDENSLLKVGYISSQADKLGYRIIVVTPRSMMWKSVAERTALLLVMALAVIFTAVVLIYSLSRRYTRSIEMLTSRIATTNLANIQNPMDQLPEEDMKYADYSEISYLYAAFGHMQERLNRMINREIAWKTRQIQQRFAVLQSQINPHFMYNTLNTIGLLGLESGNENVFGACKNLSNLLRYSIVDKNGSISSIGEETGNVRNYLELMKLRFEDGCIFSIWEDEKVLAQKIPRVSLQPFVENIFEHAMSGGTIYVAITAEQKGDRWEISIQDSGPGMDSEKIQKLSEEIEKGILEDYSLENEKLSSGIGIVNTLTRLKIYYGSAFMYSLENTSPGFRVRLSMKMDT